jgi:predicted lactoylglutathione lyase
MGENYRAQAMIRSPPGGLNHDGTGRRSHLRRTSMNRMIFVNLAVSDLEATKAFYTGLGFSLNPEYSDDHTACVVISDTIVVMALQRDRFADFVAGPVADPAAGTAVINCLSAASREEVDDLVARALRSGGKPWLDKMAQGPMYGHSFCDPDGHVWEVLHMELGA